MDQSDGQKKYGYLNQLSTTDLEEILRADIESSEGGDEDLILYILEVIEQRKKNNQTGVICDVDEAWEEFQDHYMGLEVPLYPIATSGRNSGSNHNNLVSISTQELVEKKPSWPATQRTSRTALKRFVFVAATIALLLAGMVTAQAVGMDVFGALARWTDETFRFVSPTGEYEEQCTELKQATNNPEAQELHDVLQNAFHECGIPESLIPCWLPEGCVITGGPKIISTDYSAKVSCEYTTISGEFIVFSVQKYSPSFYPEMLGTEKDTGPVDPYLAKSRLFYIMSNNESINAAWSDGKSTSVTIFCNTTLETLKRILDSMGE